MPPIVILSLIHGMLDKTIVLMQIFNFGQVTAIETALVPGVVPVVGVLGEEVLVATQRHPAGDTCREALLASKQVISKIHGILLHHPDRISRATRGVVETCGILHCLPCLACAGLAGPARGAPRGKY